MRTMRFPSEDGDTVDALVTDRYLDALLTSGERGAMARGARTGAVEQGTTIEAVAPDAELRHASDVVRASLVRVHPSFRFEEHLAARLAELAAQDGAHAVAADGARIPSRVGALIPFPGTTANAMVDDPLLAAVLDGRLDPTDVDALARATSARSQARPIIVGGAITSAAISLVGVAWVAWRAARPGGSTMARAAREARARRLADLAELAAGVHGGPA